jgi:hypothetical protein
MKQNSSFVKNASHYGDILAIPFFLILSLYFYNIQVKTTTEYILLLFSISGLFSYVHRYPKNMNLISINGMRFITVLKKNFRRV